MGAAPGHTVGKAKMWKLKTLVMAAAVTAAGMAWAKEPPKMKMTTKVPEGIATPDKLETRIVRIFNTYGPRMRLNDGRVVPAFISQALKNKPITVFGKGLQTRSFCYVSDLVEGIYRLMMSDYSLPVNIGNPHEMTVLDFAQEIIRATGSHSRITYRKLPQDDPKQRQPNIAKARKLLKWAPAVPLNKGLAETIRYFKTRV